MGCCCSVLPIIFKSTFSHCRIHKLCPFLHNPIVSGLMRLRLQTITMCHCQKKVVHMLLFVVRFVVFDANDYFALMAFHMARSALQTIAMCHCQEKVVHVLLLVVQFVVLDANDYFALVAFQMARLTLQTIAMRHCQEKVMHMLLLVV